MLMHFRKRLNKDMPTVHYVCPDAITRSVQVASGLSVMEAAAKEGIPGMIAECGGAAACATCHVYIDERFLDKIGVADDFEGEMLDDAASERRKNSRLACQVTLRDDLDGLIVVIAPKQ